MDDRRDPIERLTDRVQDAAIAHAPTAVLTATGIVLLVAGVVLVLLPPLPRPADRFLVIGLTALGSVAVGIARWVREERKHLAALPDQE